MIADAIALIQLVREVYSGYRKPLIISALFDWKGKRIEGDKRLEVEVHYPYGELGPGADNWWYSVKPLEDYKFVRMPVNPGGVIEAVDKEDAADRMVVGAHSTDARYFRYVHTNPLREWVNVRVDFMVFAYKPSDLLSVEKGTNKSR